VHAVRDREAAALQTFADLYPETTLLVDTYDTREGARGRRARADAAAGSLLS
jgi:nicotinic acid phosphoribosyltransferase